MQRQKRNLKRDNVIAVSFNPEFFFERGIRCLHRQDLAKAYKYFKRCVEWSPRETKYLIHLAAVYTEMGDFDSSNQLLSEVVHKLDEREVDCYYYMAHNYAHMGDFDLAEQYALLYLQESENGFYAEEAEDLLDLICYELDRTPRELDQENRLIGKHEKARACLEQGKFHEASKLFQEMIEEYPHFLAARNNLSLAYYYMGQFDQALNVLEEILEIDATNLHALCNLAVFLKHRGEEQYLKTLVQGLKKIHPLHMDHRHKLATTLGILGEDERAYEMFVSLTRYGFTQDPSLYHYTAAAAFNMGKLEIAKENWEKLKMLNPEDEIVDYYLGLIEQSSAVEKLKRVPYHYHLPYEVQLQKGVDDNGQITVLKSDPLIRSSLFWALRYGNKEIKLQAIQSLAYFADHEVEETLRDLLLDETETDDMKQVALFVLHQIGAPFPYQALLKGKSVEITESTSVEEMYGWIETWQKIQQILKDNVPDDMDFEEAERLFMSFVHQSYPRLPQIRKAGGWAAALEYLIAQKQNKKRVKTQLAKRYGISLATLNKNIKCIEESILLDSDLRAHYHKGNDEDERGGRE